MKNNNDYLFDDLILFMLEFNDDEGIKLTEEEEDRIKLKVQNYLYPMTPNHDTCHDLNVDDF
tara:strand:- start:2193 stop:2378 length:186 start_codon:yes stop_codon:yes gene_type:complete